MIKWKNMANLALILVCSLATEAAAHDGHHKNMSDAEMVAAEHALHANHPRGHAEEPYAERSRAPGPIGEDAAFPAPGAHNMISQDLLQAKIAENRLTSAGDLLGRLHPIAAHFPIALLILARWLHRPIQAPTQ